MVTVTDADIHSLATEANHVLAAQCRAQLEIYGLPGSGPDAAKCAAGAMVGASTVVALARQATDQHLMTEQTYLTIEALAGRLINAWAVVIDQDAEPFDPDE